MLAFLALVLVLMAFNSDTRIALYVTPVWVLALPIGYFASRANHVRRTPRARETSHRKPKPPAASRAHGRSHRESRVTFSSRSIDWSTRCVSVS